MEEIFYEFLESTFDYKKLKKSRLERKLSLSEVSEKTGIPFTTLKRYEDGDTKKIPLEAVKKICSIYGEDVESFFIINSLEIFNKKAIVILLQLFNFDITRLNLSEKYYKELKVDKEFLKELRQGDKLMLNPDERKEYIKFKEMSEIFLEIRYLEKIERENFEKLLLTIFYMKKIIKNKKF